MSARRPERPNSDDLFSAGAKKTESPGIAVPRPAPDSSPSPPRYLLPKDLPGALARLDSREIDALLTAVIDEMMRRGRLTAAVKAKLQEATRGLNEGLKARTTSKTASSHNQAANAGGPGSLTVGQTNAVRAAFMAGVKPSTIARQFGISQAAVRKALASEARLRKP